MRLNRAKWIGPQRIRLRFDPFAYRYVRLKVLARDGYTCYWCGEPGFTVDHIIPWSKGGRTTMENCICACQECNGERGDMSAEEFARLRNVPPPDPARIRQRTAKQLAAPTEAALAGPQGGGTSLGMPAEANKRAKQEPEHPADGRGRGKAEQKAAGPAKQQRRKAGKEAAALANQQGSGRATKKAAPPTGKQRRTKQKRRIFSPEAALALRWLLDPYGPRVTRRQLV